MENMLQAIQRGARETVAARPHILGCPACGMVPAVSANFFGQFVIYCDEDECPGLGDGNPQAMGATLAEATKKWNSIGETHD